MREPDGSRRPAGVSRSDRPISLEEASDEPSVDVAVVAVEQRAGEVRNVTLARVALRRHILCESARAPPLDQPYRVKSDLGVTGPLRRMGLETKELFAEEAESLDHIEVAVGDAEPEASGVERTVAHEVAEQLGQLWSHPARRASMMLAGPVRLRKWRERHLLRLTYQLIESKRHQVAFGDLPEPLPRPRAVFRNDLDPVLRCPLDPVATRRRHINHRFEAVDVELGGIPRALVGVHLDSEILPLLAVHIAQRTEPHEAALGGNERASHETPGWSQNGGLRVAVAVLGPEGQRTVPRLPGRRQQVLGGLAVGDLVGGVTVLADHPEHRCLVRLVLLERAHALGYLGRGQIAVPGHQSGDRSGPRTTLVGVVGEALGHQEGTEVGVALTQLTELEGVLADRLGRVGREAHRDLLGEEHDLDRVLERIDIEVVIVVEELHQVKRGEVASRVIQMEVLGTRVRCVDATALRARVPVVDRRVVLHAGVRALPRRVGKFAHQSAGLYGLDRLAGRDRLEVIVRIVEDRLHELVVDPHRVVGVLVLDRVRVGAVEVHVEAGVAERTGLVLLERLAPDEVLDVGVTDVEHDHLGRAPGGPARLDRSGGRIGAAHEGDGTGSGSPRLQTLFGRTDAREVDAGAGAVLEDPALFRVPVEDRVHLVLYFEDETRCDLLATLGTPADVEPHRGVERGLLGDQEVGELVLEDLRLVIVGEVAAGEALLVVAVHDPVDHLFDRPFALGGAGRAPEVLLRGDVGGVLGPRLGDLDPELLEGDDAGAVVLDHGIAKLPLDLVVGMNPLRGEVPPNLQSILVVNGNSWCHLRNPSLLPISIPINYPILGRLRKGQTTRCGGSRTPKPQHVVNHTSEITPVCGRGQVYEQTFRA